MEAGIPHNAIQYAVLATGLINVIMTGISVSKDKTESFHDVQL